MLNFLFADASEEVFGRRKVEHIGIKMEHNEGELCGSL